MAESTLTKMSSVKVSKNRAIWLDSDLRVFCVRVPGRVGNVQHTPADLYSMLSRGEARRLRKEVRKVCPAMAAVSRH